MMMGVAQVIGIKPTLRSFFSGAPAPCAKTSVAVANGRRGHDGFVTCLLSIDGGALRPVRRGPIMLAAVRMPAAGAASVPQATIGIKRIVERSHVHGLSSRAAAAPPSILAASCRQPLVPAYAPAPSFRRVDSGGNAGRG